MFFDKVTEGEFFLNVDENLNKLQKKGEARQIKYRNEVIANLTAAADTLNKTGFVNEAKIVIKVCKCIEDQATKGLDADKMLKNLENQGIVLNLTDKSKNDDGDEVIID